MAQETNPPVLLKLGEQECVFKFNARAWRLIQEHGKLDILELAMQKNTGDEIGRALMTARNLPRLVWACLQNLGNGEKPEEWPSFEFVEEHLGMQNVEQTVAAIVATFPKKPPEVKPEPVEAESAA